MKAFECYSVPFKIPRNQYLHKMSYSLSVRRHTTFNQSLSDLHYGFNTY